MSRVSFRFLTLAFLAVIAVVVISPRAAADCGANPSVSIATTGPNQFGDFTLQVTYSFPDTTSASQRRVELGGVGPGFNIGFGSISPTEASGVWTVSYNAFCWAAGQYPFTATATSCNTRSASTTVYISTPEPPRPSVSVSYAGPDPKGKGSLTIGWGLPNTKPEQRAVYYSVLPEGSAGGAVLCRHRLRPDRPRSPTTSLAPHRAGTTSGPGRACAESKRPRSRKSFSRRTRSARP
jgi:hypothetical protein